MFAGSDKVFAINDSNLHGSKSGSGSLFSFVILDDRPQIKDPDKQFFFGPDPRHCALLHYHVCWMIKFFAIYDCLTRIFFLL